jgi:hypothetical protein
MRRRFDGTRLAALDFPLDAVKLIAQLVQLTLEHVKPRMQTVSLLLGH